MNALNWKLWILFLLLLISGVPAIISAPRGLWWLVKQELEEYFRMIDFNGMKPVKGYFTPRVLGIVFIIRL